MEASQPGTIGWLDLTVADAAAVRDFYRSVVGWTAESVPMGSYSDYCMKPEESSPPVAGICHAAGPNTDLPPVWLVYINVENLASAVEACRTNGGEVLQLREPDGHGQMAIIRDPAGAICALYQPAKPTL